MKTLEDVYLQHNVDFATGKNLDKILGLYGKYRYRERRAIIEIKVFGLEHNLLKLDDELVSEIDENNPIPHTFYFYQELERDPNNQWSKYLIIADRFKEELTQHTLENLKITAVNLDLKNNVSLQKNIVRLNQRKLENDADFRERALALRESEVLENELRKIPQIDQVLIKRPTGNNNWGKIEISLRLNDLYTALTSEKKRALKNEIAIAISEFMPIGFEAMPILKNGRTNFSNRSDWDTDFYEIEQISTPLNDFISQTITETKAEDVLNYLNSRAINFNYSYNELTHILRKLFLIDNALTSVF